MNGTISAFTLNSLSASDLDFLDSLTFVVAINDVNIFQQNLLSSPLFQAGHGYKIIQRSGYRSASIAYNSAIEEADTDIVVFIHQDVFLPAGWLSDVKSSLEYLEKIDPGWGILGCFGSAYHRPGGVGQIYTTGRGVHGNTIKRPERIETLDEVLLITRKSSGLRFDPELPHFHLYGTDICMSAKNNGMACYAIPAFCVHNTNQILRLPTEFYQCYKHIKKRWNTYLPIYTSCIIVARNDSHLYSRRARELWMKLMGRPSYVNNRISYPDWQLFLDIEVNLK